MDIFGPQFNATNIQSGVDQTNTNYGGYGIASSKVSYYAVYVRVLRLAVFMLETLKSSRHI